MFLTVHEVAKTFRVTPLTIYRAIHRGRLEAVRLGENGPFRVPAAAIEDYAQPASRSHATLEA